MRFSLTWTQLKGRLRRLVCFRASGITTRLACADALGEEKHGIGLIDSTLKESGESDEIV